MFALVSSVLLASTTYITGCGANCRIQYTIKSGVEDANLGLFELKIVRNKEAWNEEGKRMSWFGWGWKKMKLTAVKQMWNYKTKKYEDVTKPLDLYHYAHCDTERFAAIEPNPKSKHRIYTIWRENNKSWSRAGIVHPARQTAVLAPRRRLEVGVGGGEEHAVSRVMQA